jgi:hypothetical protein
MNRATIVIGLGVIAFAVTLGVYIGGHLSDEAMSVLIGAACGAGAMVPAVIIAVLTLSRRREREEISAARMSPPQAMYPPVIVVASPAANTLPSNPSYSSMPPSSVPRQFTVIGDDSLDPHLQ